MVELTANDLKVRGKQRFVVTDMAHYHHLRECGLDTALSQSRADVAAGRFVQEPAVEHMLRLNPLLASEPSNVSKGR